MNKLGYILFNNENIIGIFDDEEFMNTYINGCIQNNFFNRNNIKIEKYTMNSLFCHDRKINKEELIKNKKKSVEFQETNNKKINLKELQEDENYKKIIQEKADTKHEINELKQKKKKIDREIIKKIKKYPV